MSLTTHGHSFTEVTVIRMRSTLHRVPSRHAGVTLPRKDVLDRLLPVVTGSSSEIAWAMDALVVLGLVLESEERLTRTAEGDRIVRCSREGRGYEFSLVLLRSGLLGEQIRRLLGVLTSVDGGLACSSSLARRIAPQLTGVLLTLPGVSDGGRLTIPSPVAAELESPWNLWTIPPMALPGSLEERQEVGDRAELYSLKLEVSAYLGAWRDVLWVSRDDAGAGYDIEASRAGTSRAIEVKGSRGTDLTFLISDHEMSVAERLGSRYEVHFWGDIRLGTPPSAEYDRLRQLGYPIVVSDAARSLRSGGWSLKPTEYRAKYSREPDAQASEDGAPAPPAGRQRAGGAP